MAGRGARADLLSRVSFSNITQQTQQLIDYSKGGSPQRFHIVLSARVACTHAVATPNQTTNSGNRKCWNDLHVALTQGVATLQFHYMRKKLVSLYVAVWRSRGPSFDIHRIVVSLELQ